MIICGTGVIIMVLMETIMAGTTAQADTELNEELDQADTAPFVTPEKGRQMFDAAVRRYMGMGGEEFLRRWDSGEFRELYDEPDHWYVGYLIDLRSFAEQEP